MFEFDAKCVKSHTGLKIGADWELLISARIEDREVDDRFGEGETEAEEFKAFDRNFNPLLLLSSVHLSHLPQISLTFCVLKWLCFTRFLHNVITNSRFMKIYWFRRNEDHRSILCVFRAILFLCFLRLLLQYFWALFRPKTFLLWFPIHLTSKNTIKYEFTLK